MFLLLFGETLTAFLAALVTVFFIFHIWLVEKAMTTIEFCEKSMKRTGYDMSTYNKGPYGNVQAVLGDNPVFWLFPGFPPSGTGLGFLTEETPLARDMETGRGLRMRAHRRERVRTRTAGTGSAPGSGQSEEEETSPREWGCKEEMVAGSDVAPGGTQNQTATNSAAMPIEPALLPFSSSAETQELQAASGARGTTGHTEDEPHSAMR